MLMRPPMKGVNIFFILGLNAGRILTNNRGKCLYVLKFRYRHNFFLYTE